MKATLFTLLASFALASAIPAPAPVPAPQQGPAAWFPDVWYCRCHSQQKDAVQPLCSKAGGNDMTIYPPAEPDQILGRNIWCQKISTKSAPRANRLAGAFNDAACQKEFGAGFVADCSVKGTALCFGEEECN